MTDSPHVLPARNDVRRWLVGLALGLLGLSAHAQISPLNRTTAAGHTFTGTGTTFTVGNLSGFPTPTTTTWNVPAGTASGHAVGNFGMGASSGGMPTASSRADMPIPGGGNRSVPLDITNNIPKSSAGRAIGKFAMKGLPILGTASAAYDLMDDLGFIPKDKDGNGETEWYRQTDPGCTVCFEHRLPPMPGTSVHVWQQSRGSLCQDIANKLAADAAASCSPGANCGGQTARPITPDPSGGVCKVVNANFYDLEIYNQPFESRQIPPQPATEVLATEQDIVDKIAAMSGWPTKASRALADALNSPTHGISVTPSGAPTVTGPASVAGPTSTKVEPAQKANPDGTTTSGTKTTTTTTTYNNTYSGNTVNITNNTTSTSITNYNDGTSKTETTTESKPVDPPLNTEPPPPPEDPCKANPDRVGCQTLEEPEKVEMPKTTKELTYSPENLGGGGACPADIVRTINGQSITVFRYTPGCQLISTYMKPIVLMLSAFIAFMILVPKS